MMTEYGLNDFAVSQQYSRTRQIVPFIAGTPITNMGRFEESPYHEYENITRNDLVKGIIETTKKKRGGE